MSKNLQVLALVLHLLQYAYYSLLITHYSLLITHYSLLITHYSLLITHHQTPEACEKCGYRHSTTSLRLLLEESID